MRCILCGSEDTVSYPSTCSPFLAERVWGSIPFKNEFIHCNACDFSFHYPRPSDRELDLLYNGYREEAYQIQRQKHETGYTKEFNEQLGSNKINDIRRTNMRNFLVGSVDFGAINNVLDYGGYDGQFILNAFNTSEKYVYDPANVLLVNGVKQIKTLDLSDDIKFDFIQCCHVLEHANNPRTVMKNILRFSHKNTLFYFEVPFDTPLNAVRIKLFIKYPAIKQIYSYVTLQPNMIPFAMHEHISYFSEKSLIKLMELSGLKILKIGHGVYPTQPIIPEIVCLAKRHSETFK